jgi:ribonuclease Z
LETALKIASMAHTIPDQMGKILKLANPRMAALWHLNVSPGVDAVFEEVGANYSGPVTVTQDLTVFNVTKEAVVARQADVLDDAPPVHGRSHLEQQLEPRPADPAWWSDALLEV